MSWSGRVFDTYDPSPGSIRETDSLPGKVRALVNQQIESWPALRLGIKSLSLIEMKRIGIAGTRSEVVVQHNPGRIRSTAAKVDARSVATRKCFLCPENMPPEEKSIQYRQELMVACNPFPVLENHLSIVHRDHIEQKIDGNVELLLELARDFGPDYFLLYNGPRAGASAPDHLHFQACSRSLLPIETDLKRHLKESGPGSPGSVEPPWALLLDDCGRSVFVFTSSAPGPLTEAVYSTISVLKYGTGESREPMMNIIVTFDGPAWALYLFPRARHRPARFFSEGEDRLTVSPGAIDMAGVVVVPEARDFTLVDSRSAAEIFAEVSLGLNTSRKVLSSITAGLLEVSGRNNDD
ncbi:MAG TPA: DUF4922 domain-containing protein, partial [Blastocatellia bacterium]|nr:DUF4922 domain-containing protein [Blastocatellia bacterium]